MDIRNLLVLSAFGINLVVTILIYLRAPRTKANITFEITAFAITMWCLAMVFYRAADASSSILFAKLLYFFPSFIPTSFLLFGLFFPNHKVSRKIIYTVVASNALMAALALINGAVIKDVIIKPGFEKEIIFGWAYWLYNLYIPVFFISSYLVLIRKYFKENRNTKLQIAYILLGMTAASVPAMITNLNLPTFGYFELNWNGQLWTVFWVGGVAYAIIKHRMLDIRMVVVRSLTYIILISSIGLMYTLLVFILSGSVFNTDIGSSQTLTYLILALFIAFTFQPLRSYLNKVTDKVFFKNNYDSNELLSRLSKILATTIDLSDVTKKILTELLNTMRVTHGIFLIHHENKFTDAISEGIPPDQLENYKNKYSPQVLFWLAGIRKIVWFEDQKDEISKQAMRDLKVSLIIPLMVGEKFHGLLLFGDKKSGEIYSSRDIDLFQIFGPEISIAIENAKAYEEIRKFNITLKEEVDRQTKDLQNANQKLKELDKLKDEFVSLASHELRTPMTIIKSYLWLFINKKKGQLTDKESSYLERAYTSTERLINLVNDMLNVSRIESGRLSMKMQSMQLMELLERLFTELTPRANQLGLKLNFTKPTVPIYPINADPERMEQVIINLIGNSFKFTPSGGEIEISVKPDVDTITVQIKDNGKGMNQEVKDKLFQKFGTMGGSYIHKQEGQGTGLGLYLSKSLIEMQGGKIWADSEGEGKGSTFSFSLPYKPQD